jgi:hypothetical protein
MPPRLTSSADLNATIEWIAPGVLALLANGAPRREAAIVAALAGRHARTEIKLTLMRLSIVGRLDLRGSRYSLMALEAERG